ncbi:MAG TPA: DUF2520 domain-containing protein [Patescibacteria group bacterium]|nr:DUF2520 domain-containing protein [Patescibacteria group bacterium]
MKAWRDEARRRSAGAPDPATLDDLRRRGIDLDPTGHDHGGTEEPGHSHPHGRSEPGEPPLIGIIGAGAVGTALGTALHRAGWPVVAVGSRDAARRERFRALVPTARAFAEGTPVLDEAELIILAVPDDAIAGLAGELRLYSGQALVHTSGVLGAEVLEPARAAGTQVGAFHPLVAFADTERAVAALHGATVAIEGDDQLAALLADMADALGATAVRLAPGSKAAYHAAAVLAAGGFVALLDAIAELGAAAGLDEAGALAVYGGLIEQTLDNARALGIRAALTGPMTRGDVGTLERHLDALARFAPGVLPLYRAAAEREIELAESRGSLAPHAAESMRRLLAMPV